MYLCVYVSVSVSVSVYCSGVDRVEFLTAMLVQMTDLDKEKDIDPWLKRFDELDADGSGTLDEEVGWSTDRTQVRGCAHPGLD